MILLFISVMTYHSQEIINFAQEYKRQIISTKSINTKLTVLMNDFVRLRSNYAKSISSFNEIFPIINIFGSISSFFIANLIIKDISAVPIIQIINMTIFIILIILYYWNNGIAESSKQEVYKEHTSPEVIAKFFNRSIQVINIDAITKQMDAQENMAVGASIPNLDLRNNQLIESHSLIQIWEILKNEFISSWDDFTFLSIPLQSLNIIQKVVLALISLILSVELADNI